ncbi:MAG: LpxL/LpxP family acyltransferase [Alphaproteobacteria bacterium]
MSPWRRFKFIMEALGFRLAMGILRLLSPEAASNLGGFLGRTIGPRLGISRRARQNLRLAFPEKPSAEIETIVRGMWDNLGRVAGEYPHLGRITAVDSDHIELVNVAAVWAPHDGPTASIQVSAHLANWEIVPIAAARIGVNVTVVVREPNNPYVRPLLDRLRGVAGGTRAYKGAGGARQAVRVLRDNGALGLLFDQKMNTGIALPFFGVEAMTLAMPAYLALRFRCPLIPIRVVRLGPARFRIEAYPPLVLPETADRHVAAAQIMAELNGILEGWIRERPEQWLWLHRRWPDAARRAGSSGALPDSPTAVP